MTASSLPHIVIVGAGFGGLRAARRFSRLPVQVTLIDRQNYHLFQPLLYQVATAGVSAGEIAYPVRAVLRRQRNARFLLAEVTDLDLSNRRLLTTAGEVRYDALILAMGGQTNFFGNAALARHALTLKTLQDAERIRDHVLRLFEHASRESNAEKCRAMLTFAVAGGGPSGVEMVGALSELIHGVLKRDFPGFDLSMVQVILLEAADRLLPAMPPALQQATLQVLHTKGVEVWLNAPVESYDGTLVRLKDGRQILSRTLIWVTGIRAAGLAERIPTPRASNGRIRVQPTLQVPGFPEVFVIGDAAYLEDERGNPLPMVAPVALQ
ncbi:NAD(P)/FAD-dependent oxidoreductase [Anaerolinea sp.]|uniref:NAD(P)/FAD-dependent oxidoreductase n=1 Tax=Anaerolinea sp. TaxID=1872519 RepID=UPI002ACDEA14|nr:NAD(P)/FAD-dependent oxidoreductase [Anaerolinea sp.]